MILSNYIIDGADLESNNFKENIPRIKFGGIIVFILGIKYRWGIKGNNIEIHISPLT